MICSFDNRRAAVEFVNDLLQAFPDASPSITTTPQGKFVVVYAPFATGELSEDTAVKPDLSILGTPLIT